MTDYVELHARSAFSFLEGASTPEQLIATAAHFDMPAMALADTDSLSGAPRFYLAAKKAGLQAHLGVEVTAVDGGRYTLFAESRTGYQNICRLLSTMKLRAPKGQGAATEEDFRTYSAGIICLTRGEQDPQLLLDIYGRHQIYAELTRDFRRESEALNQRVIALADRHGFPLLATNGVRYAEPKNRELMDALTCIRHKTTVDQAGRLLEANAQRYLKPPAPMRRLFSDYPQAIANTRALSERLDFTLAGLGYQFPLYPVPPGETIHSFLRQRTREGALQRYGAHHEAAYRQIDRELNLIKKLNLGGYFLIVWDIVRFCREHRILAQGRGSAANSAVCYSLGITAVDPVKMKLLFERFLSEERGEWPDIDIDLPSGDQRESVIQYVYQRYGQHGAAMTANIITYRGRSAIRDIGKALGYTKETLDPIANLVSRWGFTDPHERVERPFEESGQKLNDPRTAKFIQLYREIQDLPRHLGQHSGGMVISQNALSGIVPLEPATMPGRVVLQWDKEDCADLGLIKVDLLGLGMLAALEESIELIQSAHGDTIDLSKLNDEDPKVYAMIQRADTVGLFQVESRAQMASLPLTQPRKFYDLVVQVAIIRPGPIVGKMYHPFVRRRQGLEEPISLHPLLDDVLERTLGVPLFQEQLLRMAMIVANFSGGEAEELRRAMGFKRSEQRMRDIEVRLRKGMTANGIDGEAQEKIVQSIISFALYGFPESHAASFALLAYASAWLRTYYPAAFTAALLNQQPMGFYHPATLVKDAQRHGVRVLPVDVTKSDWRCNLENQALRLGLNYARGLRGEVAKSIVAARHQAPFASIVDLTRRVPELRKDEVRLLASIGALNQLEAGHRRDALWQSELALRPVGPLLSELEPANGKSPLSAMSITEKLVADFAGTSMTVGRHPVAHQRAELNRLKVRRAIDLGKIRHNTIVKVAGCVICRQRPPTAKGFAFLSLEDETGIANAIVAPDMFDNHRAAFLSEPYLLLEGVLQNQGGAISIKVGRVTPLKLSQAYVASHDFR